jgi:hypothetical protein
MFTSFLLLAGLTVSADPPPELAVDNVRLTTGILGPRRTIAKFLPGDNLFVSFNIAGITCGDDGKVKYSVTSEVTDSSGKSIFRQPPQNQEVINVLGGHEVPAYAQVSVGINQPAGEYKLKVTITDLVNNKSQSATQTFEVLPPAFGLVRMAVSNDPDGRIPVGSLFAGQTIFLHGAVVGFQREGAASQPKVVVEMRVLDEAGKPTLAKPFSGTIDKDVPAKDVALPFSFMASLNRAGKFTLELTATDKISGKTTTQSFPFVVNPSK